MQIDLGNPVVPDEHAITAACEKASVIFVQLMRRNKPFFINSNSNLKFGIELILSMGKHTQTSLHHR